MDVSPRTPPPNRLKRRQRRPHFGALAVGIGLEKASDTMALVSMGCDLGQGFLFGQPLPQERFIALLKQRVTVRPAAPAASSDAEPAPAAAALQTA